MNQIPTAPDEGYTENGDSTRIYQIEIEKIMPNPAQPRKDMDQRKLQILSENIKKNGVIQPITVRLRGENYLIIAGERRWRAAQMAGLSVVPVIMRSEEEGDVPSIDEISLIENMQREDLNLIDEVEAINNLRDRGKTVEEIKVISGRSATHIKRATRVNTFFKHLMAGGFADYSSLVEISARYGLSVIEKAARTAEETDDLEKGLSLLQSSATAGELGEKVEIELADIKEKREGGGTGDDEDNDGTVVLLPAPAVCVPTADPGRTCQEIAASSGPVREPERTGVGADDSFLDEVSFSSRGNSVESPESDTKYTQNGETTVEDGLSGRTFLHDEGDEKGYDEHKDVRAISPHTPAKPSGSMQYDRKVISGEKLLKKLEVLKRAMEDLEPVSDMQFKIRQNDRKLLGELAKDVECLMPGTKGALSAIKARLASPIKT